MGASVYKDDDEVRAELSKTALPGGQRTIDALLGIRFDKFPRSHSRLSVQIVPLMELVTATTRRFAM